MRIPKEVALNFQVLRCEYQKRWSKTILRWIKRKPLSLLPPSLFCNGSLPMENFRRSSPPLARCSLSRPHSAAVDLPPARLPLQTTRHPPSSRSASRSPPFLSLASLSRPHAAPFLPICLPLASLSRPHAAPFLPLASPVSRPHATPFLPICLPLASLPPARLPLRRISPVGLQASAPTNLTGWTSGVGSEEYDNRISD